MKIYVKNNDINKAVRVLKKKMLQEGDTKKIRSKAYFVSKGEQRRLDEKAGRKRWLKKRVQIERDKERAERKAFMQRKKASQQRKAEYNKSKTNK